MSTSKIYDSANRKRPAIEELLVLFQYRDLIFQLVRRDLVARYKRSVLGVAWTMLNPLGTMLILLVVFSNVFSTTENYAAYIISGIVCWTMFSQVHKCCDAFHGMGKQIDTTNLFTPIRFCCLDDLIQYGQLCFIPDTPHDNIHHHWHTFSLICFTSSCIYDFLVFLLPWCSIICLFFSHFLP